MKTLEIKDLDAAKELSREELAAVRGGMSVMPGGCYPAPGPQLPSLDPQAMMDSILAQMPAMPPMPSYPTLPGHDDKPSIQPV